MIGIGVLAESELAAAEAEIALRREGLIKCPQQSRQDPPADSEAAQSTRYKPVATQSYSPS